MNFQIVIFAKKELEFLKSFINVTKHILQIRPIRIRLTVQNLRDSVVFKITHFLRNRSHRLGLKLPLGS